jgi:crossover junction endodeoxyribonuclease RuvC
MVVLGVDPGLVSTGFGAISCLRDFSLIRCGDIKTSSQHHLSGRLVQIYRDMVTLVEALEPDLIAIENIFSLVRYPRAGILLGSVLGVIYLAVSDRHIPLMELTPREVKSALTGYGAASKRQVRDMVCKLLGISELSSFHSADALAVAMAAFYRKPKERLH